MPAVAFDPFEHRLHFLGWSAIDSVGDQLGIAEDAGRGSAFEGDLLAAGCANIRPLR